MKNKSLIVSEVFYSIQGEGQTMGMPAVFLRLAGCNLLCEGNGWRCDTIEVWQKGRSILFEDVLTEELVSRLKYGAHLIITGGEPMLYQFNILNYLDWFFNTYAFKPCIEIETNGTIVPVPAMKDEVTYWNCSPKLSTSGTEFKDRFNELALVNFDRGQVVYKFVISCEADILEVLNDYDFLDFKKFIFMPAGDTQEKLNECRPFVVKRCIELSIRYCDRLHIIIWNQKTGV